MSKCLRWVALMIFSVGFVGVCFGTSSASALTYSSDVDVSFTFNSVISVQLSSANIYINNLAPGTASDSNIITVGANTNASAGFQLSATVGVKNGTTALVNNSDSNYTFTNLSSTKAALTNFSDNTWGYSYCANTAANCNGGSGTWVSGNVGSAVAGYNGLPLDNNTNTDERGKGGVVLISTTGTQGELNTVQFKIGAKASNSQVAGTYTNTINFYAVANPEPMTIHDVVYMQNFATMTASDKADVLNSMTTGAQYQLKDNRDEKPYYISKLADGNVWMTQNLDHNIVTTANFYTPANTDITANWTASAATYTTGTTTWDSEAYSTIGSYDPGNVYWSGTLGDSTPASSGNAHYHLGNYYNWTAAIAMNNSADVSEGDANQSICPAGWTLPKSGSITSSGSFRYLLLQYNWNSSTSRLGNNMNAWESPFYFGLTGGWSGSFEDIGGSADFWSSVAEEDFGAYRLFVSSSGTVAPGWSNDRSIGSAVRCIVR